LASLFVTPANQQITFIGLSFVFANVLTLFYYDPKYEGLDLPVWVYFSWSIGLFAYQSECTVELSCAKIS
jgi:ethanolaminephosphotransferase